jgi:hypothetical protein
MLCFSRLPCTLQLSLPHAHGCSLRGGCPRMAAEHHLHSTTFRRLGLCHSFWCHCAAGSCDCMHVWRRAKAACIVSMHTCCGAPAFLLAPQNAPWGVAGHLMYNAAQSIAWCASLHSAPHVGKWLKLPSAGPSLLRWKFKVIGDQPSIEFGCIPESLQVGVDC